MTQYARPDADVADGQFVNESGNNTNLYAGIDESSAGDSDFVTSTDESAFATDTMTVGLSNVTDPSSAANHIVRYRAKGYDGGMGGSVEDITVALLETSTSRASATITPATSFTDYSFTLSTGEANSITNYNNLRLKFTRLGDNGGSEQMWISQAYFECPDASASTPIAAIAMNTYRQMGE